jgi:hypothetical protein
VAWPFTAEQYKEVRPSQNGRYISISASKSDGGDLDGGYGAVIKAKVAPATGAPDWKANGTVSVDIDNVDYTITVKVLYIDPSTGLGTWQVFDTVTGNTYSEAPSVFKGYALITPVEYRKYHSWTLPSSGNYPAKVRVDFSISASGSTIPALTSGKVEVEGGC